MLLEKKENHPTQIGHQFQSSSREKENNVKNAQRKKHTAPEWFRYDHRTNR